MNRMLIITLTLIFGLFALIMVYYFNISSNEYMLSEKCGKSAREHFKFTGLDDPFSGYENHYNTKLNKCFSVVHHTSVDSMTKSNFHTRELVDINENKIYGQFFRRDLDKPSICNVNSKKCQSIDEWKGLIKPYMEQ